MQVIRSKTIFAFGAALAIIFISFCCTQPDEPSGEDIIKGNLGPEIETKLESMIKNVIEAYDLPGLAIGIVMDNEIAYARGFGFKNIDKSWPITSKTLFHMASISKPFVATAIMQLVEQDKINLEAPVTTYLPYFKLNDERYKEITIQQMLSHVSGMPDVMDYEWDKPQYDPGALERYVRSLTDRKMRFRPGQRYAYSNMAFECLGDVIAKVSGMSFADYEKKHILDPAGMKDSTFLKPHHLPENWAAGHLRSIKTIAWDGYPYNRRHGPSSTLHSNALEMCNWAITNINRGTFQKNQILKSSSYDVLWKPWTQTGRKGIGQSVGLSWFLGEYKGEKTVGHGGGDVGFNTNFIMLPEKSMAVVVLCNFIPAPVSYISDAALDILHGYEPRGFTPPASIRVGKTLAEKGPEAAVKQWNSMKEEHAAEYDFNPRQYYRLVGPTLELNRAEDVKKLIQLCLKILPEHDMKNITRVITSYVKRHPDNKAGPAALEILRKRQ
ncbi:MAG: beta-lactamase family protein [Candidatus Aminicenantes bacterium]|nr:MAG: beta-lactamase family protein [Candidatus Aminicenantes bacterium]